MTSKNQLNLESHGKTHDQHNLRNIFEQADGKGIPEFFLVHSVCIFALGGVHKLRLQDLSFFLTTYPPPFTFSMV